MPGNPGGGVRRHHALVQVSRQERRLHDSRTYSVRAEGQDPAVPKPLAPGDELRCLHCGRWHPVHFRPAASETPDSARMLFWECRGQPY